MKLIKVMVFLVVGLMQVPSFASQVFNVKDNDRVVALITKNELNHIAVQSDRIKSVRGLSHQYFINKDSGTGQIYIKLFNTSKHQPINLFVTTQKGKTYQLYLLETLKPTETILLKPY